MTNARTYLVELCPVVEGTNHRRGINPRTGEEIVFLDSGTISKDDRNHVFGVLKTHEFEGPAPETEEYSKDWENGELVPGALIESQAVCHVLCEP